MQWDDTPGAGFTSGTPWLPVNPNHERINVTRQLSDPSSVLHYHRRLIELRHTLDVVAHGDFTLLAPEHPTLFAYLRRHDSGSLLVVANCSRDTVGADEIHAALPAWRGELLLANHDDPAMRADGHVGELGAWQARVYRGLG
jgi:oligo-1,6-glucosidase